MDIDTALDFFLKDDPILRTHARSDEDPIQPPAGNEDPPELGVHAEEDQSQSIDEINEPTDEDVPALIPIDRPDRPTQPTTGDADNSGGTN